MTQPGAGLVAPFKLTETEGKIDLFVKRSGRRSHRPGRRMQAWRGRALVG
jgi:hypothetical protein